MALSKYELNGLVFKFDERDAKRLGAKPVEVKAKPAPKNKARGASAKSEKQG